jgi:WD40 repeat protein
VTSRGSGGAAAASHGLIVGGMSDGVVSVWDAGALLEGEEERGAATTAPVVSHASPQKPPIARAPLLTPSSLPRPSRHPTGAGEQAQLAHIERHTAPVRSVQFNPNPSVSHLLAAGTVDGDISIINLEAPGTPTIAS